MIYRIVLIGCDADTEIEYDLTLDQGKLLQAIAKKLRSASKITCMPTMYVFRPDEQGENVPQW